MQANFDCSKLYYCSKCKKEQNKENSLVRSDAKRPFRSVCKDCRKAKYELNKVFLQIKGKEYRANNIEKHQNYQRKKYLKSRERILLKSKTNRDIINFRVRNRYNNDQVYKLSVNLRNRTLYAFKSINIIKRKDFKDILGVSFGIAKKHIERQFTKGMTWANHGKGPGKWEIDHIIPYRTAKTEADVIRLSHYTNLQPLWSEVNRYKSGNIIETQVILAI